MKKILFLSLFLFVGLIEAFAQKPTPQKFEYPAKIPPSVNVSSERLEYIDRLLLEYVDKGTIPHALTFVARKGVVVHHKAFGWSDIGKWKLLKKSDIFRNYSQTKAIVSVALMTLFEQGKFRLDDPLAKYIPECTGLVLEKINSDSTYTTRPVVSPITIRHLLSHTSGIMGNRDILILHRKQRKEGGDKPYETLAEEVKDILKLPLAFDPGTQWNYHPATDVCGYLIEYFSGKSLREYVKETILIPLGMKDSDWYYPESYRSRMVKSYINKNGVLTEQYNVWSGARNPFTTDFSYCQAGTGLNGTIEDYARFCQMILNGGIFNGIRIIGRRTLEMMCTDQLPHPNNGGEDFHFGLGFQIYPERKTEDGKITASTSMVSPGSLHWGGFYNTDYLIDPKEELVILLYMNVIPNPHVWEKFLNTVYQALQ
ncbi:MAG: beta-lactamase family protein [Bacteroides sp.]|nr:beta-lactamase family protein [Bacteroides sp.]